MSDFTKEGKLGIRTGRGSLHRAVERLVRFKLSGIVGNNSMLVDDDDRRRNRIVRAVSVIGFGDGPVSDNSPSTVVDALGAIRHNMDKPVGAEVSFWPMFTFGNYRPGDSPRLFLGDRRR